LTLPKPGAYTARRSKFALHRQFRGNIIHGQEAQVPQQVQNSAVHGPQREFARASQRPQRGSPRQVLAQESPHEGAQRRQAHQEQGCLRPTQRREARRQGQVGSDVARRDGHDPRQVDDAGEPDAVTRAFADAAAGTGADDAGQPAGQLFQRQLLNRVTSESPPVTRRAFCFY
jgi:hypothetical protein